MEFCIFTMKLHGFRANIMQNIYIEMWVVENNNKNNKEKKNEENSYEEK